MKMKKIVVKLWMLLCMNMLMADEYTPQQKRELGQKALHEMMQQIYSKAMEAKRYYLLQEEFRGEEEIISNFATTAPRSEFIVQADVSAELQAGTESATVYVSTDNQATWQSAAANFLGTEGYETTWGGTISTGDGNTAFSYLSGIVNSEALGEEYDYGTIVVSGTPHNINGNWPPGDNLYAPMVIDEPSGDAAPNQDIIALHSTYQGSDAVDDEGNDYIDVERFYMNLTLNTGCCDEGGLFGPWYLYGVGIVNPDPDAEAVAYAIGYGDGGFGQLYPGLLKLTGDLATGQLDDFDYITTNILYSTSGNNMQATALMSYITNDSEWGTWPNAFNGFIVQGVTVEASLDGLEVDATILDQTAPGLMVCTTTYQDGNNLLSLSDPEFDSETNTLSVIYSDEDGNLPWYKAGQVCNTPENGGNCFCQLNMIPDSHTYEDGVRFSVSLPNEGDNAPAGCFNLVGDYEAHIWFADDDIDSYPSAQINLPITIGVSCDASVGDINNDEVYNVLDIVTLATCVLNENCFSLDYGCAGDMNGDEVYNVLDIVTLATCVLNENCG